MGLESPPECGSVVVGNGRFPDASGRRHGVTSRDMRAGQGERIRSGRDDAQSAGSTGMDNWPFVLPTGLDRAGRLETGVAIDTPNDVGGESLGLLRSR